jgi:hypothetical protein
MEDPPPKKPPWPAEEDVEVEYYTSSPSHETKIISMRFVGRDLVGVVRGLCSPPMCLCGCALIHSRRARRQSSSQRSDYNTYRPLGLRIG